MGARHSYVSGSYASTAGSGLGWTGLSSSDLLNCGSHRPKGESEGGLVSVALPQPSWLLAARCPRAYLGRWLVDFSAEAHWPHCVAVGLARQLRAAKRRGCGGVRISA